MFEMKARDAFGRVGVLETNHGDLKTPTVLPVIDPVRQEVPAAEVVRETGASALITNAYLIYRDVELRKRALRLGVHELLDVDCPIATDSGGYQIYRGQDIRVPPSKIHEFQADIGSDLAVVLDKPPGDDMKRDEAESCVRTSIERCRELDRSRYKGPLWYGVVHMTPHDDLRREQAEAVSEMGFDVFALGSCVGSLMAYRFEAHLDRVLGVAEALDPSRPRHVFGVGHPMFLSLSVALGGDLFDSAMYALAAKDGRYLTEMGTMRVQDLVELPCSCPSCRASTPESMLEGEEGRRLLSLHNLHSTFSEIRRIREAIRSGSLWELTQARCRSHPNLLGALKAALAGHSDFLQRVDPLTKNSALFYMGEETRLRPEVQRAVRLARERLAGGPTFSHPLYGEVPSEASLCYPFGQTVMGSGFEPPDPEAEIDEARVVGGSIDYQYGRGCGEALRPFKVNRSPKTHRIRTIERDGESLGVFRAKDFAFLPSWEGASILKSHLPAPEHRVTMSDEAVPFVSKGLSAFAKFVETCDPAIIPGQEVFLVDSDDHLLATGTTMMNSREMRCFNSGVAAKVRHAAGR